MSYSDTRYTGQPAYGTDFSPAIQHASAHHGGNEDLFANALSFIQDRAQSLQTGGDDIDEEHVVKSHQALYGDAPAEGEVQDDRGIGAGAAMQALKMFTSGQSQTGDGGFDQNQLIGLAMAQAGKLWDQKASSGAPMVGCFFSLLLWGLLVVLSY